MRGTLIVNDFRPHVTGIIPAYAGNTQIGNWSISPKRDHPRVCGEHCDVRVAVFPSQGSSPRMRGTQKAVCNTGQCDGIIPAYAGNTLTLNYGVTCGRDHPRVCGEHTKRL